MRALLLVNPNATRTDPHELSVITSALQNALDLKVVETTHRGHASSEAATARATGIDLVIAIGGDGTINEIVNGFFADPSELPLPALGLIQGGLANVLARNLGVPRSRTAATGLILEALASGRRRQIGIGRFGDRYFTFNAGIGIDARVVRAVEQMRAAGDGSARLRHYVGSTLREFYQKEDRHAPALTVRTADGQEYGPLAFAAVSNTSPWTYFGLRPAILSPEASFDTGLDLFGMPKMHTVTMLRLARQVISLTHSGPRIHKIISLHDQPWFEISSSRAMPTQVDGEYLGTSQEVRVISVPEALSIVL